MLAPSVVNGLPVKHLLKSVLAHLLRLWKVFLNPPVELVDPELQLGVCFGYLEETLHKMRCFRLHVVRVRDHPLTRPNTKGPPRIDPDAVPGMNCAVLHGVGGSSICKRVVSGVIKDRCSLVSSRSGGRCLR